MKGSVARSNRRRDIQGLRAVAILAVVAYHAGLPVPGGYVGVDVFFVISGYLITQLLYDELSSGGRFSSPTSTRVGPAVFCRRPCW